MSARAALLAGSLALAAISCDQRVEVLTIELDAGTDAQMPAPECGSCAEDAVCSDGQCVSLPDVSSVAAGNDHTCLISGQQLFCTGSNAAGQLGLNDMSTRNTPARLRWAEQWFAIAAGARHTCGLRGSDGRGTLHCWGNNDNGQLGYVTNNGQQRPRNYRVGDQSDWTQIKCGGDNCCALRESGALYCWGANADGSAGQSANGNVATPTRVAPDSTFTPFFGVGGAHACAIRSDKALLCWGKNGSGQLGMGASRDPQRTPMEVPGAHDWLRVAAGLEHTCGIRGDHELSCWGSNSMAQIGSEPLAPDGEPITLTDMPGPVAFEKHWVRIAAGGNHTCALRDSRDAYCWGAGNLGQLGSGTIKSQPVPTKVARGLKWRELGVGRTHSCGIVGGDMGAPSFYCWGDNDSGKLGIGDTTMPRDMPVALTQ